MGEYRNATGEVLEKLKKEFLSTVDTVNSSIGENAFRNYTKNGYSKKFHPAIFDAIMVSVFLAKEKGLKIPQISCEQHLELLRNEKFKIVVSNQTTNIENIKARISLAGHILFGLDFNEK